MAMVKRSIGVCKRLSGSSSCLSTSTATSDNDIARRLQLPPFDYKPRPYKGPLADEVFAKRKKFLGPSLFHFYQKPHVNMHQGIGNGLPLAAVVTTPEIASVMAQKLQFNTFGGNPVCSAGGLAVLRVLDKEKRQSHCADVGSHLIQRLRSSYKL